MEVLVLSTEGCVHCRKVLDVLEELRKEKKFTLRHVTVTDEPEILEKYPIMSSPE